MQTETTNNGVMVESLGSKYKLRFDDTVVQPSYYRFELEALSQAQQNDQVQVTVNSEGGSLASGIEIANAIFSCSAEVEGILRSSCHSCGSIIFLACQKHDVGLASCMLLHSGNGYNGGTPNQSVQRAKSYKRQVRTLFETVYKGFLSDTELDQMIEEDKEFIFAGEEIVERLHKMYSYRQDQLESYQQEIEDQMWEENTRLVDETLETLDISGKEKEAFLKVRDMLDNTLQEPTEDSVGEVVSDMMDKITDVSEPEQYVSIWSHDGNSIVGNLHFSDNGTNYCDLEFTYMLDGEENCIVVDETYLDSDDRVRLAFIIERITGKKDTEHYDTQQLIDRFISEMYNFLPKN